MYGFLDPKNDFAFKRVFGTEGNKEILINFLNDVLEGQHEHIEDVEFLKIHQDPEVAILRQSIVDVLCRDSKGKTLIVEMQCATDTHFINRAVAYACRAYLNQRTKLSDGRHSYENMRPVIFFAIMERTLFPEKSEYLSHHKVTDVYTGENDIKNLSFSFLELSKFNKTSIEQLDTNIEKWMYFFKNATAMDPSDVKFLEEQDRRFWSAYSALAEYNYTPEELLDYERYAMKQDQIATLMSDAKKLGRMEGKAEIALTMLSSGMSIEDVSKFTNLSTEDVQKLVSCK